ncbi:hypothetical protein IFM89_036335 [Coptis chinensis]|uniref:Glabrous enhancer-binding protein-like DBD domain-containing protein n=1 Tax=Coptis chinensis TaxID=261450 RepID=A0A835IHS3_9MAGN|nr:hypothetical protein IFM89_036335 [Coptis chinensis]
MFLLHTISYMAERVVGTGSFGIVFQAKCLEAGETVAIKKVLQDMRYKNRLAYIHTASWSFSYGCEASGIFWWILLLTKSSFVILEVQKSWYVQSLLALVFLSLFVVNNYGLVVLPLKLTLTFKSFDVSKRKLQPELLTTRSNMSYHDRELARKERRKKKVSELEEVKKKGDVDKDKDKNKKNASAKLWSENDETVILKGLIEFKKKGKNMGSDLTGFLDFIKEGLDDDTNRDQLKSKLQRLKQKYQSSSGGFTKPHEVKLFELSKQIWGERRVVVLLIMGNNGAGDSGCGRWEEEEETKKC